jgi:hypothetical protein
MWYFAADVEQQVINRSVKTVLIGAAILAICTIVALIANKLLREKQFKKLKLPLFIPMAAAAVLGTFILAFNTVYLNVTSESKGPVHWHADIEFWACGSEIELRDPTGFLSNKIGTSTYHEHNDKRIHLEGVVVDKSHDASLGKFMEVTGGYINDRGVGISLNEDSQQWLEDEHDGDQHETAFQAEMSQYVGESAEGPVLDLRNGSAACGDQDAEVQAFVYQFDDKTDTYRQKKLDNPASYVILDKGIVPPGDCIIVEFDKPKSTTDRLCQQFGVRDSERCVEFGVKEHEPELCNIRYEGIH